MFNLNFPFFRSGNTGSFGVGRTLSGKSSGILMAVVGLALTAMSVFMFVDNEHTKNWPVTNGRIENVDTRVDYDSDGNRETEYRYSVVYTVGGQTYTNRETSSSYVASGDTLQVAYNPEKPNDSRVKSGAEWLVWVFAGVGIVVAVLGAVTVIKSRGGGAMNQSPQIVPQPQNNPTPIAPSVPSQTADQGTIPPEQNTPAGQ